MYIQVFVKKGKLFKGGGGIIQERLGYGPSICDLNNLIMSYEHTNKSLALLALVSNKNDYSELSHSIWGIPKF